MENSVAVKSEFQTSVSEVVSGLSNTGSMEEKALLYNAVNSTDEALRDQVGKVLNLKNFVVHKIEVTNEQTGEVTHPYRCVLIDENNVTYGATSQGIAQALQKLIAIMGMPENWEKPIPIKISKARGRKGYEFLTFSIVMGGASV